ncbi:MAG: shikimate kinase [Betaproteobacteria bacterium]
MRVLIFGNSGAGKSFHAQRLARRHALAHLDLDTLVWEPGATAVPRPAGAARRDLDAFVARHAAWAIEGCYAELIETAAPHSTELLWLDPPLALCRARALERPWEPHKYPTAEAQAQMRAVLLAWVDGYDARDDDCSRRAHQRVFDAYAGPKRRLTAVEPEGQG